MAKLLACLDAFMLMGKKVCMIFINTIDLKLAKLSKLIEIFDPKNFILTITIIFLIFSSKLIF